MIGTKLKSKLFKELLGTKKRVRDVCEDLGIDYEEILTSDSLQGIDQCSHCMCWHKELILDLDSNPICRYCKDLIGL